MTETNEEQSPLRPDLLSGLHIRATEIPMDHRMQKIRGEIANDLPPEELDRLRKRLVVLHRLNICKDLEVDSNSDLVRLKFERIVFLALDGGGFFIMWTMQLLKEMERVANDEAVGTEPPPDQERFLCNRIFDLIAGSSAGAVTAALLTNGWSARRIEKEFWQTLAPKLWPFRNPLLGATLKVMQNLGFSMPMTMMRDMFWFMDPPLMDKTPFREWAIQEFGDQKMGAYCRSRGVGLFLACKQVLVPYAIPTGVMLDPYREDETWQSPGNDQVLVRGALEAAASPPLIMQPLGPYIDAGFGADNDPTMLVLKQIQRLRQYYHSAGIEMDLRLKYDTTYRPGPVERLLIEKSRSKDTVESSEHYRSVQTNSVTAINFSTGVQSFNRIMQIPEGLAQNPLLPAYTWMWWMIGDLYRREAVKAARLLSNKEAFPQIDYRRFDIGMGRFSLAGAHTLGPFDTAFEKIPGVGATTTASVTEDDLFVLTWPMEPEFMRFYAAVGKATVEFLRVRALRDLEREHRRTAQERGQERALSRQHIDQRFGTSVMTILYVRFLDDGIETGLVPNQTARNLEIMLHTIVDNIHATVQNTEETIRINVAQEVQTDVARLTQSIVESILAWEEIQIYLRPEFMEPLRGDLTTTTSAFIGDLILWERAPSTPHAPVPLPAPEEINPFSRGLLYELMNYSSEWGPTSIREEARDRVARSLEMTLGSPQWLDAQPARGPRGGCFTRALPSFKAPFFQTDGYPFKGWGPFPAPPTEGENA